MDVGPLWTRVKDAKLALDLAFNYLDEVQRDLRCGAVPESDGRYAYQRALRAQEVAAQNYMDALSAFKDAVRTQKPRATAAGEPEE